MKCLYVSDAAIDFLLKIIKDIGLEYQIIQTDFERPILVASWLGSDPSLPSILLNSHTDVVPVYEDKWRYDPFDAVKEEGKIFGRGTQDMKCVTIQYLKAIQHLKSKQVKIKRTVHLTFMPGNLFFC